MWDVCASGGGIDCYDDLYSDLLFSDPSGPPDYDPMITCDLGSSCTPDLDVTYALPTA